MTQNNEEVTILINHDNINYQNYLNNNENNNNMIVSNNNNTIINNYNFNSFEYECLFFYHRQGYFIFNYLTSILFIFIVNQYIFDFKNYNTHNLNNQTLINLINNYQNYQLINIFLSISIIFTIIYLYILIYLYYQLNYRILNQNYTFNNIIQIIHHQLYSIERFYKVIFWCQNINLILLIYWLYNDLNLYRSYYSNLGYILFFNHLKHSIPFLCLLLSNYCNYNTFQHFPNNIDHNINQSTDDNINQRTNLIIQKQKEIKKVMTESTSTITFKELNLFLNTNDDWCCPICLEKFNQQKIIIQINNCQHLFHQKCLKKWLNHNYTCPNCRFNLLTE